MRFKGHGPKICKLQLDEFASELKVTANETESVHIIVVDPMSPSHNII